MNIKNLINKALEAIHKKDRQAFLDLLANKAIFEDPHYPNRKMKGKEEISKGLDWAFKNIKQFNFVLINHAENIKENVAAFEYDCAHVLPNGQKLKFKQVFFVEMENGKISKLRAYLPYPPEGISGIMLKISHLFF